MTEKWEEPRTRDLKAKVQEHRLERRGLNVSEGQVADPVGDCMPASILS